MALLAGGGYAEEVRGNKCNIQGQGPSGVGFAPAPLLLTAPCLDAADAQASPQTASKTARILQRAFSVTGGYSKRHGLCSCLSIRPVVQVAADEGSCIRVPDSMTDEEAGAFMVGLLGVRCTARRSSMPQAACLSQLRRQTQPAEHDCRQRRTKVSWQCRAGDVHDGVHEHLVPWAGA